MQLIRKLVDISTMRARRPRAHHTHIVTVTVAVDFATACSPKQMGAGWTCGRFYLVEDDCFMQRIGSGAFDPAIDCRATNIALTTGALALAAAAVLLLQ